MDDAEISMAVTNDDSASVGGGAGCCSFRKRCQAGCSSFLSKINAEPVILLSMTAYGLITTIKPLFLYWARCVQMFADHPEVHNVTDFCLHLAENSTSQDIVERDIATWNIYLQLGSSLPTLLIAPILGAWADGTGGRKKPLILSLVGLTVYGGLQVAATTTYKTLPVYPFLFLAELTAGLCGGVMTLFATSFAIVTDDSRDAMHHGASNVTVRVGIASAFQVIGAIIGAILASLCTSNFSHEQAYIVGVFVGCILMLLTVIYTVFLVKETHSEIAELEESARQNDASPCRLRLGFGAECWKDAKRKGTNLIQVLIEKREGWTRFCLNMSLLYVFVEVMATDSSLLIWITKRPPFDWSDKTWTIYSIFKGFTFSLGMIVFPALIARTNWLGKDSILIMTGIFSAAVTSIMVSFAQSSELLFIIAGLGFFAGGITPGFRSFIPRMVRKEETARLFTAFGVVMTLCPIISTALFNSIFKATLHFWPGFVFLIAGIIMIAVIFGQGVTHMLMRPLWLQHNSEGFEPLMVDANDDILDADDFRHQHSQNPIT